MEIYFPERKSSKEAWQVVLHDLRLRKTLPPQTKYNAAQRIAYTLVILMGIGSFLTGFAIYKPVRLQWLCTIFGGYAFARILHFTFTILFSVFFVVHIIQVAFAGWNNFAAMIRGFEVHKLNATSDNENKFHESSTAEPSTIPNEN